MSTQVSNPYSFNIINGLYFSGNIIIITPEISDQEAFISIIPTDISYVFKVTIPAKVNVIKSSYKSTLMDNVESEQYIGVTPNATYYFSSKRYTSPSKPNGEFFELSDYENNTDLGGLGVNLGPVTYWPDDIIFEGYPPSLSYSNSINQHTPIYLEDYKN